MCRGLRELHKQWSNPYVIKKKKGQKASLQAGKALKDIFTEVTGMDNKAMYKLSYGLFVLTTKLGDKHNGCITNTAIQVTTDPNRIAFAVNKLNLTHDMLLESKVFNISIISEEASFDLFKWFGFQSGREVEKFPEEGSAGSDKIITSAITGTSDITYSESSNGITYIKTGTNAYISGNVISTTDFGTHTLFICDVTDMEVLSDAASATYAYYQENIKPKPGEIKTGDTVGTLEKGEKEGQTVWVCKICGYVYEGEDLPEDFICPWCKHPASDFEKVVR